MFYLNCKYTKPLKLRILLSQPSKKGDTEREIERLKNIYFFKDYEFTRNGNE